MAGSTYWRGAQMFKKILLAVDGSESSAKAVGHVEDLARAMDSEVLVFHLREMLSVSGGAFDVDVTEQDVDVAAQVAAALKERNLKASSVRRKEYYRRTAQEIVIQAHDFGADLIVMGSRGLSGLPGMLLGSVTQKVLHFSDIPVLVIPDVPVVVID
jgi:nucleotide-binding universal stress UspA family protein